MILSILLLQNIMQHITLPNYFFIKFLIMKLLKKIFLIIKINIKKLFFKNKFHKNN